MKKTALLLPALFMILLLSNKPSIGQIVINTGSAVTPDELVEKIVGDGIFFDNISFAGANFAKGIFSNGQTTNLGIDSGIFLTTGSGNDIPGPNSSSGTSTNNGMPGDPTLNTITTSTTYDASVLQFDVIPFSDTLFINYVYGTEEYPECIPGNWNDVFGFFVSGPNPLGGTYSNVNIGFMPDCEFLIDNVGGLTLEYDGFTSAMTGWLLVVPCTEYHIKIAIADCGDAFFDSGIFIKENSLSSPGKEIEIYSVPVPSGFTENMVEGYVGGDVIIKLPEPESTPFTLWYEIGGTAINGFDYEWINNSISFGIGQDSAIIHVNPLYDGYIEGDETIVLIIQNTLGCFITYDTIELIIEDYVEMTSSVSPNTLICSGDEVELWVNVYNGIPPYTYFWEPGSFTNDTIVVSPEETTTYTVTYSDIFGETGMDSVKVTVFNGNANNIITFSFLVENNPFLPENVYGTILEDSVLLFLPPGQSAENLIAAFTLPPCATALVNGDEQLSGVSANDFTFPIIYQVMAANGELHDWLVVVEIGTGMMEEIAAGLILFPNPSTGKIYLEAKNIGGDQIGLKVMDLTGRIVYEIQPAISERYEIDLSGQLKGMYFLRVKFREKEIYRKMIIQ